MAELLVSMASEHPVRCAKATDGCTAQFPGSKHDAVRAHEAGWFFSRREGLAYCPEHVPDWVPAWRARQARKP